MQVDIVTETEFPRLLNSIEAERQKFVSGVREHYDVFMQAAASEKQQILRCSPYSQPPAPE
jgi:5'(3')-deoxyribonucleotidase